MKQGILCKNIFFLIIRRILIFLKIILCIFIKKII